MVVKFTTYVISAYRHWCYEFESRSRRGVQQCVIKFVNDLRQVGCFLNDLWQVGDFLLFTLPSNKTDSQDITEILLKVALNTIKQTNKQTNIEYLKSDHL
jgi:hypothetical protein